MKSLLDIKRFRLYLWLGLAFFLVWMMNDLSQYRDTFTPRFWNNVWRIFYVIVVHYIFFEYTLPRISWKRAGESLLLMAAHVFLYSVGLYVWRGIGIGLHIYTPLLTFDSTEKAISAQMSYSVGSLVFFRILKHIYDYRQLKIAAQLLRIEKQEAELNYLKAQTNPHFLFNTLNNIYSLARDKSDLAPESILRLSKILRYMLYETGGAYIAIEQELKIMDDYIALEKLRYDESLRVNFNHDIEDMRQALPPLLLMPLVENAFKHGVSETRGEPFVEIHLAIKKRQLSFLVKNSVESPGDQRVKENIGLSNLRRQLELLYTDYKLSVQHDGSVFTAALHINLSSHV